MKRILLPLMAVLATLSAVAEEIPGTLAKIKSQGAIYLGYSEAAVPFSYADDQGEVRGYTWELCQRAVAAVKDKLGLAALPVVPVPVTASNRLMLLNAGTIDLECGATVNTPSRARQVAFAPTTFVVAVKALMRADSPIRTVADLNGKRVVTTLGSGSERYVKTANALRGANIDYAVGESHADSLAQVAAGKADAFVLDEPQLAALKAAAPKPDAYRLIDDSLALEPLAIALRKGDTAFKELVDATLAGLMKSGEAEKIYARWFLSPLPGKGINLSLPMGDRLKELFRNPSDRGG